VPPVIAPGDGGGDWNLFEQRLSTRWTSIRIFAVDNMLMGGSMMQDFDSHLSDGSSGCHPRWTDRISLAIRPHLPAGRIGRGFSYKLPICIPRNFQRYGTHWKANLYCSSEALRYSEWAGVEATADSTFRQIAANQDQRFGGSARMIVETNRMGKEIIWQQLLWQRSRLRRSVAVFGWKAQLPV